MRRDPIAVMSEVNRLADPDLWPGFDPRRIPVALFTGHETFLVGHPSPPPEFTPLPDHPNVAVLPGRHPSIRGNSYSQIGAKLTATVELDRTDRCSLVDLAALVVHECFHVFQQLHHPDWQANELDLFLYPIDDAEILALRRLEALAVQRAVSMTDTRHSLSWAGEVLTLRQTRHNRLPTAVAAWERGTELNEGLAHYVEHRAARAQHSGGAMLPMPEFAADAVRLERYFVGDAYATLLDGLQPAWKGRLEAGHAGSLDELLAATVMRLGDAPAGFSDEERSAVVARSRNEAGQLRERRRQEREAFLAAPGWRLVLIAGGEPLWAHGFDPMNVQRVSDGELLHARFLSLGNASGTIEVLDRPSLTEANGDHPLASGIRTITVTELHDRPSIRQSGGSVTLCAEGITATLSGAQAVVKDRTVSVHLGQPATQPPLSENRTEC